MSRIKVISYDEATGKLKEIYDELILKRGKLAEVHKVQSLRPDSINAHMNLYMETMYNHSELSRAERELIGIVVSIANGCNYCINHHAEALNHYWKNEKKIENLIKEGNTEILSIKEIAITEFAKNLTLYPQLHKKNDFIVNLKNIGLSDSAILDIVLVTAYFNYVNRIVLSLGVELETDNGTGYKY